MRDKLFVIDGHALVYRSYYAFANNHRKLENGFVTSAIFGFVNVIFELIERQKPKYLCVAFDTKGKTWRHNIFSEYKTNRPKQPLDITNSFSFIFKILDALNIKYYSLEGFEADDVIGTISVNVGTDVDVFIMTPDKDYDQLVRDNVFLFKPKNGKYVVVDRASVLEKWGIQDVKQVIDVLAIIGDNCDNVSGIDGVGIKTASKLITKYGSVENIIKNIDNLKESLKSKFIDNIENVKLSEKLVTISTDCDINFDINDCRLGGINYDSVTKIFNELEFKSLTKRLSVVFKDLDNCIF